MEERRSLEDRLLKRVRPRVVPDYAPLPAEVAPGVWNLERRLRHFGFAQLPSRTTVLRLDEDALAVVSPPPRVDAATRAALEGLGTVRCSILPNSFHYLYAREFAEDFPGVMSIGAPGLKRRAPELGLEAEFPTDVPDAWSGVLEYVVLGPSRGASEVLLFHVASRTLVLTDVAFNMREYARPIDRVVWRLSGIPGGFGPGRTSRSLLLRDRKAARRALRAALDWPFERIIVSHGQVVDRAARAEFERAFADYL